MFFAKLKDGVPVVYPLTERDVRRSLTEVSLPKLENWSNQMLEPLGFAMVKEGRVEDFPQATATHKVVIDSVYKDGDMWYRSYKLIPVPQSEYQYRLDTQWQTVRTKRDTLMKDFEWRIARYHRETALDLPHKDNLSTLHQYMQNLADITNQPDPFLINYPTAPQEGE